MERAKQETPPYVPFRNGTHGTLLLRHKTTSNFQ